MDRLKVMQIMSKGYGDEGLEEYFDAETGKPIRIYDLGGPSVADHYGPADLVGIPVGDTLAAFIVAEAGDMWTDDIGGAHNDLDVQEVINAMEKAQRDLQGVIDALEENYE